MSESFFNSLRGHVLGIAASAMVLLTVSAPAEAEMVDISTRQLRALLEADTTIVDVRLPEEWKDTGVVKNSHMMTFFDQHGRYDASAWLQKLTSISPPDTPVILICHTGVRSRVVGNWLSQGVGFSTVYNVEKGIEDWIRKGHETVKP